MSNFDIARELDVFRLLSVQEHEAKQNMQDAIGAAQRDGCDHLTDHAEYVAAYAVWSALAELYSDRFESTRDAVRAMAGGTNGQ
jgi:hypothetical protein